MGDERKELIRQLSKRNSYQRSIDKLTPLLTEIIKGSEFEILDLNKIDKIIESHPFRYPDWDNYLIRDFEYTDKPSISSILQSILTGIEIVFLYFKTHGLGIQIKSEILIDYWDKIIVLDKGLIVLDPYSYRALKIESYLDQIELNVTENGWKLY